MWVLWETLSDRRFSTLLSRIIIVMWVKTTLILKHPPGWLHLRVVSLNKSHWLGREAPNQLQASKIVVLTVRPNKACPQILLSITPAKRRAWAAKTLNVPEARLLRVLIPTKTCWKSYWRLKIRHSFKNKRLWGCNKSSRNNCRKTTLHLTWQKDKNCNNTQRLIIQQQLLHLMLRLFRNRVLAVAVAPHTDNRQQMRVSWSRRACNSHRDKPLKIIILPQSTTATRVEATRMSCPSSYWPKEVRLLWSWILQGWTLLRLWIRLVTRQRSKSRRLLIYISINKWAQASRDLRVPASTAIIPLKRLSIPSRGQAA